MKEENGVAERLECLPHTCWNMYSVLSKTLLVSFKSQSLHYIMTTWANLILNQEIFFLAHTSHDADAVMKATNMETFGSVVKSVFTSQLASHIP